MGQISRITLPNVNSSYTSTTAGTSPAWGAMAAGDLVPLGGQGTLVGFRTTGTAVVVTLDSVVPSNYGQDQNVTVTLGATDEQWVWIDTDGVGRFDQGPGANYGYMAVSYSTTTGGTRACVTIQ
jgi:hypothetical protein